MRILVASYHFHPSIGGLEIASQTIADALAARGHELALVTATEADDGRAFAYPVIRRPTAARLLGLVRDAELVWHNHLSLHFAWPLLARPRPWVVTHQTWLQADPAAPAPSERLRRLVLPRARNVAISRAVAEALPVPATVIPNPYRDALFVERPEVARDHELGFAGRLVSDKGCDLLLEALAGLDGRPRLLILGEGPEEPALRRQAARLGLDDRVTFAGARRGAALVEQLNRCRILVVPSRWAEPFGIVALEGLACGCVVVGSDAGGLPDAIGPAGLTFASGDAAQLRARLADLLDDPDRRAALRRAAPAHLARHTASAVTDAYERLFEEILGGRR